MNKKSIIIIIMMLILVVVIFAFMNRDMIRDKKEIHENAEILIVKGEKEIKLGFDEIKKLGEKDFTANLKSSGNPREEHVYTGIPVKALFEKADISLESSSQIVVKSVDGFTVILDVDEVLEDDNIYLSYKLDGELLVTRENGGSGPYQVIIRNDQFSQRWSKYVVEIKANE